MAALSRPEIWFALTQELKVKYISALRAETDSLLIYKCSTV